MFKTLILTLSLVAAAKVAEAQSTAIAASAQPVRYRYCILTSPDNRFSGHVVRLEYGQANPATAAAETQLAQDNVAVGDLGSVVAALNYMGLQGWECIGINTINSTISSDKSELYSETGYLLRRRVQ